MTKKEYATVQTVANTIARAERAAAKQLKLKLETAPETRQDDILFQMELHLKAAIFWEKVSIDVSRRYHGNESILYHSKLKALKR